MATGSIPPAGGNPVGSDKDIQYNNAGAFGGITPGAAGTVLTSGGAGVTPTFAAAGSGGALVLLEQHTASSSATLDFTTFYSSTYDEYIMEIVDLRPATNSTDLYFRVSTNGGSSYTSTNYFWGYRVNANTGGNDESSGAGVTGQIILFKTLSNSSNYGLSGYVRLYNPAGASQKMFNYQTSAVSGGWGAGAGGAFLADNTAYNAVRLLMSSGNIAAGTARIYGFAK